MTMTTPAMLTKCAWCLRDANEPASPDDSHGICARHADELLAPMRARRAAEGRA